MNINALRASSVNTFYDCQFKYYLINDVGFESIAGKKAYLGTIFHAIMEILAKARKTGHYLLKDKFTDPLYLTDICWDHYVDANTWPFELEEVDYKFVKKLVLRACESRYNPLKLKVLEIERQFDIEMDYPGFKTVEGPNMRLRGTIDLIYEIDHETLGILDWKTGLRKDWISGKDKDEESLKKDIQFKVYDLARRLIWPQYKYCLLTMHYINNGGPFTISLTKDDMLDTIQKLRKSFNQIKATDKPTRIFDDPARRKAEGFKCKYVCQFGHRTNMFGSECTEFYKKFNKGQQEQLVQISIDRSGGDASRRNDYSRKGIFQGVINSDFVKNA